MAKRKASCVFCEIVAGRAPAHRIAENKRALAILDIYPYSPGHTLVLSKRHVPFWHDLAAGEAADVFALAHRVARRLKTVFEPEFVCLMARGRRIPHTHLFLVPTAPGDVLDRYFNGLEKVQEGSDELAPLREHASREKAARSLRARLPSRAVRRRTGRSRPRASAR
jgi:histidine triad (HIT) family protein